MGDTISHSCQLDHLVSVLSNSTQLLCVVNMPCDHQSYKAPGSRGGEVTTASQTSAWQLKQDVERMG